MHARDIVFRLDLKRYAHSWRGRCPRCNYPGTLIARESKTGRVRLYCANGCANDELAQAVAQTTGLPSPRWQYDGGDAKTARECKRERALALWRRSEPAAGTLADQYLTARGLPGLAMPPALRFLAETPHPEERRQLPALIALVCDAAGAPVAIHRTFLARNGSKARVEPVKASLGGVRGGAIRLDPKVDGVLLIGEGIETAASAGRLLGLPAWAAISAGNLAKGLLLPPEARSVVIAADPDDAGVNAARNAWQRWTDEGRAVRIAAPDGSDDFNDLLLAREARDG